MKRFFLLSIFFHGILLLFLFSWDPPLDSKLFTRKAIEVSLVEKIEEKKAPEVRHPDLQQKKEFREKRETLPSPPLQKEVKKDDQEEKKDQPPVTVAEEKKKEEKEKRDEEAAQKTPFITVRIEQIIAGSPDVREETQGIEKTKAMIRTEEENRNPRTTEGLAFKIRASAPSGAAKPGMKPGGGNLNPGLAKGEGVPLTLSNIRPPSKEVDQTLLQIIRKIEAAKRYPRVARKMGIEGTAIVRFKLKAGGQVEAVEIIGSSGSEVLDKASIETVRDAAPLPYKEGWLKVGIVFKIL